MRNQRAAVTLFFLLFAIPLVWICGAVSVDYAKIVSTKDQAQTILDAAAIAATSAVVYNEFSGNFVLNPVQAESFADDVVCEAFNAGAEKYFPNKDCETLAELNFFPESNPTQVTVTFNYDVNDLMFAGLTQLWFNGEATTTLTASNTATGQLCFNGTVDGLATCVRPR